MITVTVRIGTNQNPRHFFFTDVLTTSRIEKGENSKLRNEIVLMQCILPVLPSSDHETPTNNGNDSLFHTQRPVIEPDSFALCPVKSTPQRTAGLPRHCLQHCLPRHCLQHCLPWRGQGRRLTTLNVRSGAVTTLNFFHVLICFYKIMSPVNQKGSIGSPPRKQRTAIAIDEERRRAYQPMNVSYRIGIKGVDGDPETCFLVHFQKMIAKMRLLPGVCPAPRWGAHSAPTPPAAKGWVTH